MSSIARPEFPEDKVSVRNNCKRCDGDGLVVKAHCAECGRALSSKEYLDIESKRMPCGHSWNSMVERQVCPDCNGLGYYSDIVWMDCSELAKLLEAA